MWVPRRIRSGTLLLIRLDAIGDYVLFHDFLSAIRSAGPFREHRITLCGNRDWKDLALTFDGSFVDDFFWIDRRSFRKNIFYKLAVLCKIRMLGFEVVVETRHSREFYYGEKIVRAAQGLRVIASESNTDNMTPEQKAQTDRLYTELIPFTKGIIFEFVRNREFVEKLLGQKLHVEKPSLDVSGIIFGEVPVGPFAVVFPGGSGPDKRWPPQNFSYLIDGILARSNVQVVLAGAGGDAPVCREVMSKCRKDGRILDLSGSTSLAQFAALLSRASFLVSNETGAVHIAVAVNTPVFCIANGNNFGRFTEYPDSVFPRVSYIYPMEIMEQLKHKNALAAKYAGNVREDIATVSVEAANACLKVFMAGLQQNGLL